jgi:hypothetical protein
MESIDVVVVVVAAVFTYCYAASNTVRDGFCVSNSIVECRWLLSSLMIAPSVGRHTETKVACLRLQ